MCFVMNLFIFIEWQGFEKLTNLTHYVFLKKVNLQIYIFMPYIKLGLYMLKKLVYLMFITNI